MLASKLGRRAGRGKGLDALMRLQEVIKSLCGRIIFLKCEEECLAACAGGPMMQVDHVYYTDLTVEKVDQILDALT